MTDQLNNDELLSAYVDGELTGEELAQVEERLQNDPAARELVEELRQLSSTLQGLPKESVGSDLRQKILVCGEKALEHHSGSPRQWMWAVLALAAALMLMFVLPEDGQDAGPLLAKKEETRTPPPQGKIAVSALPPAPESGASIAKGSDSSVGKIESLSGALQEEAQVASSPVKPAVPTDGILAEGLADLQANQASQEQFTVRLGYRDIGFFREVLAKENLAKTVANESDSAADEIAQSEQLEVEATTEQLANILAACNANVFACPSVSVSSNDPKSETLAGLQRWERAEKSDGGISRSNREFRQSKTRALGSNVDNARESPAFGRDVRAVTSRVDAVDGSSAIASTEVPAKQQEDKQQEHEVERSQPSADNKSGKKAEETKRVRVLFVLENVGTVPVPATNR